LGLRGRGTRSLWADVTPLRTFATKGGLTCVSVPPPRESTRQLTLKEYPLAPWTALDLSGTGHPLSPGSTQSLTSLQPDSVAFLSFFLISISTLPPRLRKKAPLHSCFLVPLSRPSSSPSTPTVLSVAQRKPRLSSRSTTRRFYPDMIDTWK
jgi:hypothetical protein